MKYLYLTVVASLIALAAFSFGTSYSIYEMGYDKGYSEGYQASDAQYPKMTLEGFTYSVDTASGHGTIAIGGIIIKGEQRILDIIKNMPEIISATSDNKSFKLDLKGTNLTILEKGKSTPTDAE